MSKADKKVTPRPKVKPFRSAKYLKHIRSLPCCNCGYPVSEAHHVETGGMGTKCGDDLTVPLCGPSGRGCHQKADKSKASVKRYKPLARKLFREWEEKQDSEPGKVMVNCLLPGADEVAAGKTVEEVVKQKHPGGRPPKYKTVEELESRIEDYFESCWVDKVTEATDKDGTTTTSTVRCQIRPYTVTGLALHLNMTREGLLFYEDKTPEFADAITRAKLRCHMFAEESLFTAKNSNGPVFSLKNNFGWKDRQEVEQSGPNGGPQQHEVVTAHAESPEDFAAFRAKFMKHGQQ